jgi:hypothetical protein
VTRAKSSVTRVKRDPLETVRFVYQYAVPITQIIAVTSIHGQPRGASNEQVLDSLGGAASKLRLGQHILPFSVLMTHFKKRRCNALAAVNTC